RDIRSIQCVIVNRTGDVDISASLIARSTSDMNWIVDDRRAAERVVVATLIRRAILIIGRVVVSTPAIDVVDHAVAVVVDAVARLRVLSWHRRVTVSSFAADGERAIARLGDGHIIGPARPPASTWTVLARSAKEARPSGSAAARFILVDDFAWRRAAQSGVTALVKPSGGSPGCAQLGRVGGRVAIQRPFARTRQNARKWVLIWRRLANVVVGQAIARPPDGDQQRCQRSARNNPGSSVHGLTSP